MIGRMRVVPEKILTTSRLLQHGILIECQSLRSPIRDCEGNILAPGDLVMFNAGVEDRTLEFRFAMIESLQNNVQEGVKNPFIRVFSDGLVYHVKGTFINLASKQEESEDVESRELCGENRHEPHGVLEVSDRRHSG